MLNGQDNSKSLLNKNNYNYLKSICKKKILSMSHPLNTYNTTTLKILKKMCIICGFKANSQIENASKINFSFLELARESSANVLQQINN